MYPPKFEYYRANSVAEALSLLGQHRGAKVLAGGHSLIPAMNIRLADPGVLIDIGRISELKGISTGNGSVRIGALTTHASIAASGKVPQALSEAAGRIGDPQVRNRGTIGGSLAHSDPAADWPAAVIALSAEMVAAGPKGGRSISADKFFVDLLTTALQPEEILQEIRITPQKGKVGQSYMKVRHPASGFAMVGIAVNLVMDSTGKCQSAGIGVTGVAAKAYRATGVENALKGAALDARTIAAAAAHAVDGVEANSDLAASADYRKQLAVVYTRRAIEAAVAKTK